MRRAAINVHRVLSSSISSGRSSISNTRSSTTTTTLFRPLVPRHFSANSPSPSPSIEIDLSNEESKRRLVNSLLYRSKQRGLLELDLVLGKWVEQHIHSMDQNGIKALLQVLDLLSNAMYIGAGLMCARLLGLVWQDMENPDLWKWLTGQEQAPEAVSVNPVFRAVHEKVLKNLNSHSAPETRSTPGQPWVRGWDDIKKGRDGPVAGNQ
ncbi:hypothetical protein ACFE04_027394 [Oxalis oulophora]